MRKDVQTVVLRAGGSKRKSGCKNSNNSKILLNGISTESSSAAAPPPGQENVNENSHQGCEVLDFMDLPMSPTSTIIFSLIFSLKFDILLLFQAFLNHKCWWWEQPLASF